MAGAWYMILTKGKETRTKRTIKIKKGGKSMNVELCIAITVTIPIIFIGINKAIEIAEKMWTYVYPIPYNTFPSRHEIHIKSMASIRLARKGLDATLT